MSIHKLTAGMGYEYLTRQVAAWDGTGREGVGLATYYSDKGEIPGAWVGSGMTGIEGLSVGDRVQPAHMEALFRFGYHPLADERIRAFNELPRSQQPTKAEFNQATRLGSPYPVYDHDVTEFEVMVARRFHKHNEGLGLPRDAPIAPDLRAKFRTEVAREFFVNQYGREPDGERELAAIIAKNSRPKTTAVAGYDLTFSPVKSVSTLWAVAPKEIAAKIELAHNAAVKDALDFLEGTALFTRTGAQGVRQVDVTGLVGTAFLHRDSRAGDPDLHTHVAIANKVRTTDEQNPKWLSIDGRVLFKATVAASETYNSALEKHLGAELGLQFAERANPDSRKRSVREVVGVEPALNERFSKRRLSVVERRDQLVVAFQRSHGRPPTPVEMLDLAQQATLETRDAKHEPRSLDEQRDAWEAEAIEVLGSANAVTRMVHEAMAPNVAPLVQTTPQWLAEQAHEITEAMEARRSTWQFWHVYAEAQRRLRATTTPVEQLEAVAKQLAEQTLQLSVSLARPSDDIREPEELQRSNGESVYRVAGADLFTSQTVLAAEQRLVDAAGQGGGFTVGEEKLTVSLLEAAANGVELNAGQATLVREMATSGARLQLAIAPAGSGKTTAMRVLADAWTSAGGNVLGLAPSAVAASELGSQIKASGASKSDTLAKLCSEIDYGAHADWLNEIGPSTLVVIDEAGMADTVSLDKAVTFLHQRGASVRLIGDDQQLAAIGAGGVLRDIRATHGALQLSELMRFTDPAEGSASLALRDGRPEALGFYLDRGRIHVGDTSVMTEAAFDAWRNDRAAGTDAIMLAPTRDLVSELNQRARADRLANQTPEGMPSEVGPTVRLGDGNTASVGDLIITRENSRKLRMTASDWVKNGDRWTITTIRDGAITAQHLVTGRSVTLPADYVAESTDLGYACTVHTAQGVTADSMHGIATGEESRQLLYTLMTRGRDANHLYLAHVASGDPHTVIHPDLIHPKTPTDVLEQILARDESPRSASTLQREAVEPTAHLTAAAQRYTDALYFAAEQQAGTRAIQDLEEHLERLVPGITEAAAWPALRSHLLLLTANGEDPLGAVRETLAERSLNHADDVAAVIDWRLDSTGARSMAASGPLPWLYGIPEKFREDPKWGPYLATRAALVKARADQVRQSALSDELTPAWLTSGAAIEPEVRADVAVWRAAMGVLEDDLRPTGAAQRQKLAHRYQRRLSTRIQGDRSPAISEWGDLLKDLSPAISDDTYTTVLAERLATMSRAGLQVRDYLAQAMGAGPLPDDHAAAALWWRISAHVSPAAAARIDAHDTVTAANWVPQLADFLGQEQASSLQRSTSWPALVAAVDHGLQRGSSLADLLQLDVPVPTGVDMAQAYTWRAMQLASPPPDVEDDIRYFDEVPDDLYDGWEPEPEWIIDASQPTSTTLTSTSVETDRALTIKALLREWREIDEEVLFTEADQRRMFARACDWDESELTRTRMVEINEMAAAYYETHYSGSWASPYLAERLHGDISGHEHFRPGYAPAGWTNLVDHLRSRGVTDGEMLAAGVATTAKTGRLIDRFRDRAMFPVVNFDGDVVGFSGRRHPDLSDTDKAGPKYLNTAETALFKKGLQLYGVIPELLDAGAIPVLVEGTVDAIAVTLASAGRYMGVAPLGTALTEDQAIQLARIFQRHGVDPVVATDGDAAGQRASERDFWLLAGVGLDPTLAMFGEGLDPADLMKDYGPASLVAALANNQPLGQVLLNRLLEEPASTTRLRAAAVLGASQPHLWSPGTDALARKLSITDLEAKQDLLASIRAWDLDPRKASLDHIAVMAKPVQPRPAGAPKWTDLAERLHPGLTDDRAWPDLVRMLDLLEGQGQDVDAIVAAAVSQRPLGPQPGQALRYRLVEHVGEAALDDIAQLNPRPPRRPQASSPASAENPERKPPSR